VAGYNVAVAALSIGCAHFLPETRGRDLDAAWSPLTEHAELDEARVPA